MELNDLKKTTTKGKKRLGRGYGSGKGGHTTDRGQKGQKSRGKLPLWFEGGQLPIIRRFPFIRGKGRLKSLKNDTIIISLSQLNKFEKDTTITKETLVEAGFISEKEAQTSPVKVLDNGEINTAVTVKLPASKSAAEKIKKAGGSVDRE